MNPPGKQNFDVGKYEKIKTKYKNELESIIQENSYPAKICIYL